MASKYPSASKLKVGNIPIDFDKDTVEAVFSDYGQVTGVHLIKLKNGENIGYVSFSSIEEAETAVDALNEELPLELSVEFVNKDLKSAPQPSKINSLDSNNHTKYTKKFNDNVAASTQVNHSNTSSKNNKISNKNVTNTISDNNFHQPSSSYKDNDLMYTRGTLHTKNGKRHVSYGSESVHYSLPEPENNIGSYIQNLVEKREREPCKLGRKDEKENSNPCNGLNHKPVEKKIQKGNFLEKMPPKSSIVTPKVISSQPTQKNIKISDSTTLPNILEKLTTGATGFVIFNERSRNNESTVSLLPKDMLEDFETLLKGMKEELTEESSWMPKIGELICGNKKSEEDEDWYRGKVLNLYPTIEIAAIDDGRIFEPVEIKRVPKRYSKLHSFAVKCKFNHNVKLPPAKTVDQLLGSFEVIKISDNKDTALVEINIDDLDFSGEAQLTAWNPEPEEIWRNLKPLKNWEDVTIVEVSHQNIVYVQSQETEEVERMKLLEKSVAEYARNRKSLDEPLAVNQLLLGQFSDDGNFYRVRVTKINDSKVTVLYIDYGNEETIPLEKLFKLPQVLKESAPCILKVKLKNVPAGTPNNQEVMDFLTKLMLEKNILKCNFTGHPFLHGVILINSDDESINDIINSHLNKDE